MSSQEKLVKFIQSHQHGLTLAELLIEYPNVPRRTLQRWLNKQVEQGKIVPVGKGPARHYFSAAQRMVTKESPPSNDKDAFPTYIDLSPASLSILAYIDQPLEARKPVGYQREFLDSYEPGKTWYLPQSLRRILRKMGTTGLDEQPAGTYSRDILHRLFIDLSWASSHLEGNTYSRLDTQQLIEQGQAAEGKGVVEAQMILNHKTAIELLVEHADTVGFNRYTLMNLHSALAENLLLNPADEGCIRQHSVEIGKSTFRPLFISDQLSETLDCLLDKINQISDPFEQSFFIMVHLPYLQPFADVNKRTSRLAANLPLIRENLCPLTFLGVPEQAYSRAMLSVYELTRVELLRDLYVWAYERSTQEYLAVKQNLAQPDPLRLKYRDEIKFIIREVVLHPERDAARWIHAEVDRMVDGMINPLVRDNLTALIDGELTRLHEGVLVRYGLQLSDYQSWKKQQLETRE